MPPKEEVKAKHTDEKWARAKGGAGGAVAKKESAMQVLERERKAVEAKFNGKWMELKGAPGQPKIADARAGIQELKSGYFREYASGIIYLKAPSPPFWVYGGILERYKALGGPDGDLGWPTTDEMEYPSGGRLQHFDNGNMYWWPDTGAIEMSGDLVVTYSGLACFGETDDDALSSKDEPYVIFAAIAPNHPPLTVRTQIYTEVDAKDTREDIIELYRGLPKPLSITADLWEHDLSDPDKYRESIRAGVEKASDALNTGIGAIPYVGVYLGPIAREVLKAIGPDVTDFFNNLVGGKDDHIATVSFLITEKQMVTLARAAKKNHKGIVWDLDSPLISGHGASYKVYVDIKNK